MAELVDVRCPTCHRHARWAAGPGGGEVEVVMAGGLRRPAIDPRLARGRVALDAWEGITGPVVGDCPACGQLLVADDRALAPASVTLETPRGPIVVGARIVGPSGPMTSADARALLEGALAVRPGAGLLADVGRVSIFGFFVIPLAMWMVGIVFVLTFLAAVWEGPVAAVSGVAGFDRTQEAVTPPVPAASQPSPDGSAAAPSDAPPAAPDPSTDPAPAATPQPPPGATPL